MEPPRGPAPVNERMRRDRRAEQDRLSGRDFRMDRDRRDDRVADRTWRGADGRDGWRRATWDGGRGRDYAYRQGERLPGVFTAPAYVVSDWGGYGLAPPPPGGRWIRYFDDAVLIDRGGYVIDAAPRIGWDQPRYPYGQEPRYRDGFGWNDGWDDGAPYPYPVGPGSVVHPVAGGGVIVVTTTTTPAVATTVTTVEERVVTTRARHATRRWRQTK